MQPQPYRGMINAFSVVGSRFSTENVQHWQRAPRLKIELKGAARQKRASEDVLSRFLVVSYFLLTMCFACEIAKKKWLFDSKT